MGRWPVAQCGPQVSTACRRSSPQPAGWAGVLVLPDSCISMKIGQFAITGSQASLGKYFMHNKQECSIGSSNQVWAEQLRPLPVWVLKRHLGQCKLHSPSLLFVPHPGPHLHPSSSLFSPPSSFLLVFIFRALQSSPSLWHLLFRIRIFSKIPRARLLEVCCPSCLSSWRGWTRIELAMLVQHPLYQPAIVKHPLHSRPFS